MIPMIIAPAEVLAKKAAQVKKVDKPLLKFLEEMKETLLAAKDPEGVGLAAPQVGRSLSIFIVKPTPKAAIKVFINPQILDEEKEEETVKKKGPTKLEGCLSLPSIWGEVKRNSALTMTYMDEKGKQHTKEFKGFIATIIQHEIDHLHGILFTKRVLEQSGTLYKSHKEKGEDIFEELEI